MKTSFNELRLIEEHLLGRSSAEDGLLFEARLILEPDLKNSHYWQLKTHHLIQRYGRQQLRNEIEQVHQVLFAAATPHQSFRRKIMRLFGK